MIAIKLILAVAAVYAAQVVWEWILVENEKINKGADHESPSN